MELAQAVAVMAVVLAVLLAAAFLLGRHFHGRQYESEELSPVSRQHIDLFQGGQLSESAVESTKAQFRSLLEEGRVEAVEASLRPGMHYVVQIRALAELGTEDAGLILERQLHRRLTDDQVEQSWYWIDLANGLRSLNRSQSLPQLLRTSDAASDFPLGQFFAAETICFLGFSGYLQEIESPLGRAALRVLQRALQGLRSGVMPQMVAEGKVGELVEGLWDHRPDRVDPVAVQVFAEAIKLLRRAPHAEVLLSAEMAEQEAFSWQISRLAALAPVLTEYLQEAPGQLNAALLRAETSEQREILQALIELRAEANEAVLALLGQPRYPHAELAVDLLRWSRDPRVGPWLRAWAAREVPVDRRSHARRRMQSARRPALEPHLPYRAILRALQGHGSPETEAFLLVAARDWDPTYRQAAIGSLGWWEPFHRKEVLDELQQARRDPNAEVRNQARAALARLGERQALQWFRQTLTNEDPQRIHEAIQIVASEGLVLLWPDLDRLADAENLDVAHHARESLERLCEEMEQQR